MRALSLALVGLSSVALAHTLPPATTSIHARAGSSTDLVSGTTFGTLLSTDQGQSWRWICEEAMGPMLRTDPLLVWTPNGNLLAGDFSGLGLSTDRGCTWTELAAFTATGVSDLQLHPTQPTTVYATTARFDSTTMSKNGLFVSTDEGATFNATSLVRENHYFSAVRVAPSQPARIYASAWWYQPLQGRLFRSDDSGANWTETYVTDVGIAPLTVMAVSPANPDVVFAVADQVNTHSLLRSENGGMTFEKVLNEPDDTLKSMEISADGQTVYLFQYNALLRSRDGGKTFVREPLPKQNVCGALVGSTLYGCGSPLTNDWVLGRTDDVDAGWTPLLRLRDVAGPIDCPVGSTVQTRCTPFWPGLSEQLRTYGVADAGVVDAGPLPIGGDDAPSPKQGCGCAGVTGSLPLAALLLAGLLRAATRTRRT